MSVMGKFYRPTGSIGNAVESNVIQPSLNILIKLSAIYKVSVDYLLGTDSSTRNVLYLDGLTDKQITALKLTADCFRNSNT